MNIVVYQKQKSDRKKTRKPFSFLQELVSPVDFGMTESGTPKHVNSPAAIIYAANNKRLWTLNRFRKQDLQDHWKEKITLHFTGAHYQRQPYSLICIDVDCKRSGSLKGAKAYCESLRAGDFPNLYYETSTNGRGCHAYFILFRQGLGAAEINKLLKRLEYRLNEQAAGHDIEGVEICGTLPELTYDKSGELVNVKLGQTAKFPREHGFYDEWEQTTTIEADWLLTLPIPPEKRHWKLSEHTSSSNTNGKRLFGEREIKELRYRYKQVAESLMCNVLPTSGKAVATVEDMAICLMILKHCTRNPSKRNGIGDKSEGDMPTLRIRRIWEALYADGDVKRQYCPKRFKVLRDLMSAKGQIDWIDEAYKAGQCCKWALGAELMQVMRFKYQREQSLSLPLEELQFLTVAPEIDFIVPVKFLDLYDYEKAQEQIERMFESQAA